VRSHDVPPEGHFCFFLRGIDGKMGKQNWQCRGDADGLRVRETGSVGEAGEKRSAMLDKTKSMRDDVGPVDPVAR
jgi:hypothetical protein